MYYCKGKLNLSKLDEFIENHPELVKENKSGDLEIQIDTVFHTYPGQNGNNMTITMFDPKRGKGESRKTFAGCVFDFDQLKKMFV